MSRTITAMYDSRHEAETARAELQSSLGVDARIVDQSSAGSSESAGSSDGFDSSGSSSGQGRGFWSELKDVFMADEDRQSYEEGIRRGGFLLTAMVSEDQADRACDILDQTSSVDFESREQQWRSEGWAGYQGRGQTGSTAGQSTFGQSTAGQSALDQSTTGQSTTSQSALGTSGSGSLGTDRSDSVQEEHIPIVEEQLRVGKREVSRGGARVRSYVEEVPVEESVSLREEHVSVERRPVDQALGAADLKGGNLFQDRTIEMTETAEEAVVAKEARVTEEVVVSKTATEHTEQVHDTVRHTKVDVDEGPTDINRTSTDTDRGAFGFDKNR